MPENRIMLDVLRGRRYLRRSAFVTISGAILYGLVVLGAVMALRERRLQ
jgi:hypothetical protein